MSAYRCPLGKLAPTVMDAEKVKRDGWQENGILVVSVNDARLDYFQREFVRQIGEKLYGEGEGDADGRRRT